MLLKLKVILWKNLIIRKRHWFLTIVEFLIPVLLFTGVSYGRSKIDHMNKVQVKESTYFPEHSVGTVANALISFEDSNLWYVPYNSFTEKLMRKIQLKYQIPNNVIRGFASEADIMRQYHKKELNSVIAVVFNGRFQNGNPKNLSYDIWLHNKGLQWDTTKLYDSSILAEEFGQSASDRYLYQGFIDLQIAIDTAFMEISLGIEQLANISFFVQQFPYPPHTRDSGLHGMFLNCMPLVTIFSFIFMCPAVLQRVVQEKDSGIKELMRMVGMKRWMLWLGWLLHAMLTNVCSLIAIVVLMKFNIWDVPYPPIEYCDGTVLFVFLLLYLVASISLCFLVSTMFNRPSVALIMGVIIWIFSYFVPRALVTGSFFKTWFTKLSLGIFPNMALHYGYGAISVFETREIGVQWNNLFESGTGGNDDITMGNVMLTFIFDAIFYMILAAYVDQINPGSYGIARPLYFPIQIVMNFARAVFGSPSDVGNSKCEALSLNRIEQGFGHSSYISIRDLYKKYGCKNVVESLNMEIYENQITVLLGHNGAGKTTTMSIITGMTQATRGKVFINNDDIQKDVDRVRKSMGLCPQHNLLFPDLTVKEHLCFFSMLKGYSAEQATKEALVILKKFKLHDKSDDLASTLSGGMKRKLCLGMAVIGNSELLVLDEPTAGMDPESRREVWNLLMDYKKSRTILITTHFMEEADSIGDWIGIMREGSLQCYGTPMFLKKSYETGYHMALKLTPSASMNEHILDIKEIITKTIPGASLLRQNGSVAVFNLPLDEKAKYAGLFLDFESRKSDFNIEDMGLSVTTMNDVFLETCKRSKNETDNSPQVKPINCDSIFGDDKNPRNPKIWNGLWQKRWFFLKRKISVMVPAIVLAFLIIMSCLFLSKSNTSFYGYDDPKLNLNLDIYGQTEVFYGGLRYPHKHLVTKIKSAYDSVVKSQRGVPMEVQSVSGGIIDKGIENIELYKKHLIAAAEFNVSGDTIVVNCMYSSNAFHSAPISVNLGVNAVLKALLGSEYGISTANHPFRLEYTDYSSSELAPAEVAIYWLTLIPLGLLVISGNFLIFPYYEISSNFIKFQFMTGVSPLNYWLINIVIDAMACVPNLILILLAIFIPTHSDFGVPEFSALLALFATYMFTTLPFTYLLGYKKTLSGAFAAHIMLGMFVGIIPTAVVFALQMSGDDKFMLVGKVLRHILLCLFPQFGLHYNCLNFSQQFVSNYNWKHMEDNKRQFECSKGSEDRPACCHESSVECQIDKSYFTNKDHGLVHDCSLYEMFVPFVLYLGLLWFLSSPLFKTLCDSVNNLWPQLKDLYRNKKEHVKRRDESRDQLIDTDLSLKAKHVRKSYGDNSVINDLTLSLRKKQCYGLLGVNGAGKSTTFKILTRNELCDDGNIYIGNKDDDPEKIEINDSQYSKKIGYCPQTDDLNMALSGRELITVMGTLRGDPKASENADILLQLFDLKEHADKPCVQYSGGNKRKLATCLAFVGLPQNILLDEPTNGVDPSSRQAIWKVLSEVKQRGDSAFLLCSHSMEECESLCDNIAIMKKGEIEAEGTLLSLKAKYSNGFSVTFKLQMPKSPTLSDKDSDKVQEFVPSDSEDFDEVDGGPPTEKPPVVIPTGEVPETLKNAVRKELNVDVEVKYEDKGFVCMWINSNHVPLSKAFSVISGIQRNFWNIEDFTITQASLEDVFLKIARA